LLLWNDHVIFAFNISVLMPRISFTAMPYDLLTAVCVQLLLYRFTKEPHMYCH